MSTYYEKEGKRWQGGYIILDGRTVFNPTHEQLLEAGYEQKEEQPYVRTLEDAKAEKTAAIESYDTSDAVDGFYLNGMKMWLDFNTRQRIAERLPSEKNAGRTVTTLWYGSMPFQLPIALVEALLDKIKLYAADCYDVTAAHKAVVQALESIEDVDAYDYTQGYPEMPNFSTQAETETE